jgi:hypothetical protein
LRLCCEEVRRAGDADQPYFHAPVIGQVWAYADRIVQGTK